MCVLVGVAGNVWLVMQWHRLSIIYQLYSHAFNTWFHLIYLSGSSPTGGMNLSLKHLLPSLFGQHIYFYSEKPVIWKKSHSKYQKETQIA